MEQPVGASLTSQERTGVCLIATVLLGIPLSVLLSSWFFGLLFALIVCLFIADIWDYTVRVA
jgi:hypothetical protein